jgi:CubicO group peptidase (beta-lactamase class C family)
MQFLAGIQQQAGKIDVLPFSLSLYASALTPLSAEPGEMYLYSNQGFNIAATVVERVSGMSLDKFLHQRLFVPLDMKSATFYPSGKQLENLATPYKKGQNGQLAETEINQLQYPLCDTIIRFAEAGGGLFCIPSDHVKFYQMLANKGVYKGKRILSETAVDEMTRKQTGEKVSVPYGFGLNVTGEDFGHGGAYGTQTVVSRKDGRIMMYFIQQDGLPKHEEALNAFLKAAKQQ